MYMYHNVHIDHTHFYTSTYYPCGRYSVTTKAKQTTSHKFGNLRQKVVLYKTVMFFQAQEACKFENKKTNCSESKEKQRDEKCWPWLEPWTPLLVWAIPATP